MLVGSILQLSLKSPPLIQAELWCQVIESTAYFIIALHLFEWYWAQQEQKRWLSG